MNWTVKRRFWEVRISSEIWKSIRLCPRINALNILHGYVHKNMVEFSFKFYHTEKGVFYFLQKNLEDLAELRERQLKWRQKATQLQNDVHTFRSNVEKEVCIVGIVTVFGIFVHYLLEVKIPSHIGCGHSGWNY